MSSQNRPYVQRERAERQRATRQRIIDATVALHADVGPARTTISEIARRAGVSRLTVHHHFPDERSLYAACQSAVLAAHPPPDLTATLDLTDTREAIEATLAALYTSYAAGAETTTKVMRDRRAIPALDALLADTRDRALDDLVDALCQRLGHDSDARLRALVGIAAGFFTWESLTRYGLDTAAAAGLMTDALLSYRDRALPGAVIEGVRLSV